MDKYMKAEKELAEILGVFDTWEDETYSFNGSMKWARNNDDVFKLLLRYSLEINYIVLNIQDKKEMNYRKHSMVQIRRYIKDNEEYGASPLVFAEPIEVHEDIFAATRFAIVRAVISVLKENRSKIG
jgi:hypothetical protein